MSVTDLIEPPIAGTSIGFRLVGIFQDMCSIQFSNNDAQFDNTYQGIPDLWAHALIAANGEHLCHQLVRWFGDDFDLEPILETKPHQSKVDDWFQGGWTRVTIRSTCGQQPCARLRMPKSVLSMLRAIPAELQEHFTLSFSPLNASCSLATFALTTAQATRLRPKAMLLIPNSFSPRWNVSLSVDADEGGRAWQPCMTHGVRFDPSSTQLVIRRSRFVPPKKTLDTHVVDDGKSVSLQRTGMSTETSVQHDTGPKTAAGRSVVELRLDAPFEIDPAIVLEQCASGARYVLSLPTSVSDLSVSCYLDGRLHSRGQLAAFGDGYSYLVRQFCRS